MLSTLGDMNIYIISCNNALYLYKTPRRPVDEKQKSNHFYLNILYHKKGYNILIYFFRKVQLRYCFSTTLKNKSLGLLILRGLRPEQTNIICCVLTGEKFLFSKHVY